MIDIDDMQNQTKELAKKAAVASGFMSPVRWVAAKWLRVTTNGIRGWMEHRRAKQSGETPPEGGA